MPVQLIYRKAHDRRLKSGKITHVSGGWVMRETPTHSHKVNHFTHHCPICGAKVRSVKMPNGGWVHFEARGGLQNLKHPCLHTGEDVSHTRDPNTPDFFE